MDDCVWNTLRSAAKQDGVAVSLRGTRSSGRHDSVEQHRPLSAYGLDVAKVSNTSGRSLTQQRRRVSTQNSSSCPSTGNTSCLTSCRRAPSRLCHPSFRTRRTNQIGVVRQSQRATVRARARRSLSSRADACHPPRTALSSLLFPSALGSWMPFRGLPNSTSRTVTP